MKATFTQQMAAAAFAEEGETRTARQILSETGSNPEKCPTPPQAKKPLAQTLFYGAISIAAYVYLIINQEWINELFTRGGTFTVLPVITAFLFSFIHGAFGSSLLATIGLDAKKK